MGRERSKETENFMRAYEAKCQSGGKYKDAYEEAESEYRDKHGTRKYTSLESFKSYRSFINKRDRNS